MHPLECYRRYDWKAFMHELRSTWVWNNFSVIHRFINLHGTVWQYMQAKPSIVNGVCWSILWLQDTNGRQIGSPARQIIDNELSSSLHTTLSAGNDRHGCDAAQASIAIAPIQIHKCLPPEIYNASHHAMQKKKKHKKKQTNSEYRI